jgi:Dolichyl-phosphate-mannose-protein mannosyltransferase
MNLNDIDISRHIFMPLMNHIKSNDHYIAIILLLFVTLTRMLTVPASLWEWDDMLFARALQNYDLTLHAPHPPGFPVFFAMSRVVYWLLKDEYLALTTISLIFSSLLAPAIYYFYLTILKDRRIAFAGALLTCFVPNVWFYSGSARSDVVSFTIGIIGLTLIIRGLESEALLIAGCAVFGLGMGVRVTLLPVMGPIIGLIFLVRLRRRQWRPVMLALLTGIFCLLVWFIPFILNVTWEKYRLVMNEHSQYIMQNDTIFSGGRLTSRFNRYLNDIWGRSWIKVPIYLSSLLGIYILIKKDRWRDVGLLALGGLPYMAFTFILNTPANAPLYSLPFIPFFTGLAACGLIKLPDLIPRIRNWAIPTNLGFYSVLLLTILSAYWIYPVIKMRHYEVSPPIRALNYLKSTIDPDRDTICYDWMFTPFVDFYFPQMKKLPFNKCNNVRLNLNNPNMTGEGRLIGLTNVPVSGVPQVEFRWDAKEQYQKRLLRLSQGIYLSAYVSELSANPRAHSTTGAAPLPSALPH